MKIELLIPTKQYSNIKFIVTGKSEMELDNKIIYLWKKYYNFFDQPDVIKKLNKDEATYLFETDYQAEAEDDGFVPDYIKK